MDACWSDLVPGLYFQQGTFLCLKYISETKHPLLERMHFSAQTLSFLYSGEFL